MSNDSYTIPLRYLPHRMTIYPKSTGIGEYDWYGPDWPSSIQEDIPCLYTANTDIYERLPFGEDFNINGVIFAKPTVNVMSGDEINVTVGGKEYKCVVTNIAERLNNPLCFPDDVIHHIEIPVRIIEAPNGY